MYLIVIVVCLLFFVLFNAKVSADSPSFTLQQFTDSSDDLVGECLINGKNPLYDINYVPDIDLKSISYISDGKFLNATLWLNNLDNGYIEFKGLATFEIGKINSTNFKNNFTMFYEKFSQILLNLSNYNLSLHSFDINKFYNDNKVYFFGYTYFDEFINSLRSVDVYLIKENNNFYFIKFSSPSAIKSLYTNEEKTILDSFELNGKKIENSTKKNPTLVAFNIEPHIHTSISDTIIENIDVILSYGFNINSSHIEGTLTYEDTIFNKIYNSTNILYGKFPSKSISIDNKKFMMLIDVSSSYDKTFDYLVETSFDSTNSKWINDIYQTSADGENIYPEYRKLLKTIIQNQTSINMVPFSFNLDSANYPEQYKILFISDIYGGYYGGGSCWKNDVTSWALVPTPDFSLNLSKNPVEVRTDENKNVQLVINSLTNTDLTIFLYTNKSESHSLIPNIDKSIDTISLSPLGSFTANIKINKDKNMSNIESEYPVTLPIFAKMSFPYSTLTIESIINNQTKEFKFNSTVKESKEKHVDLTILVKPKLGEWEKFTIWTNSWLNTMTGLWSFLAGVGAVIIPLLYRLYQKSDKNKNNKLDNYLE